MPVHTAMLQRPPYKCPEGNIKHCHLLLGIFVLPTALLQPTAPRCDPLAPRRLIFRSPSPLLAAVAGPDADLSVFEGHELHVVPSDSTLTFEHTYTWFGKQASWEGPIHALLRSNPPSLLQPMSFPVCWLQAALLQRMCAVCPAGLVSSAKAYYQF